MMPSIGRRKIMLPSGSIIERKIRIPGRGHLFRFKNETFACEPVCNLLFDFIVPNLMGKEMSFWEQRQRKAKPELLKTLKDLERAATDLVYGLHRRPGSEAEARLAIMDVIGKARAILLVAS